MLFVPRIALLNPIEAALRRQFPNAKFETVSSKEVYRQERIAKMRAGELDFLVTTTILERGVTFPGVDVCVVNAHEGEFSSTRVQSVLDGQNAQQEKSCIFIMEKTKAMVRQSGKYKT